ncbi:MAG: lysostaphin resistance A-like protein [Anaerolineae bacterium]|jgi:membrane protease YdiL (CAAX protease family)
MAGLNILTRKPILSFFVLAYVISWAIWAPLVVYYYQSPFPVSLTETPVPLILLAFLGFFGPTFSALIVAGLEGGSGGVKKLLSGWRRWRVGVRWYLVILASQIVIQLAATGLYIILFDVRPTITWSAWYGVFPMFLQAALIGGAIAEETGWRGYALPRLMQTKSALTSSVIVGLVWGVWHFPISLIPGANFPVPLTPVLFVVFLFNVIFISIVMTWLFSNTKGSIFICYLYHALLNTALFGVVFHFADVESAWWVKTYLGTALRGLFALSLVVFFGPIRLSRKKSGPGEL